MAPQELQGNATPRRRDAIPGSRSGHWRSLFQLFTLRKCQRSLTRPEKKLQVFRREVENARRLLTFAITEGRRYKDGEPQLTPVIIEQLAKAEDLLHRETSPSWQERAEFQQAYWCLARCLAPVSASLLESPRLQQSRWFWALMTGVYGFSLVFWSWVLRYLLGSPATATDEGILAVVLFFALLSTASVGFVWRFSYWFTGVVTRQKLNQIIAFCYGFTLVAVLSPILMVGAILLLPPSLYRILALDSPLGITLGCSSLLPGEEPNAIPLELRCGTGETENYQWLINIGGVPLRQVWQKTGDAHEFWRRPRIEINGGLVVPIYIIVLAFIGGAVSMTRRVPEYQRRTADPSDLMTPERAREHLVFQIMQVVSAPLIAVTIYHILVPGSRATSIVLGFASGFASEPILLGIRALVEKLQPVHSDDTDVTGAAVSVAKDGEAAAKGQRSASNGVAQKAVPQAAR